MVAMFAIRLQVKYKSKVPPNVTSHTESAEARRAEHVVICNNVLRKNKNAEVIKHNN